MNIILTIVLLASSPGARVSPSGGERETSNDDIATPALVDSAGEGGMSGIARIGTRPEVN